MIYSFMSLWTVAVAAIHLLVILRVLTRPHRQPASRIAWIMVIIVLPVGGVLAYILLGEVNIGHRYTDRLRRIIKEMLKALAIHEGCRCRLGYSPSDRKIHTISTIKRSC